MPRSKVLALALATLSATCAPLLAQTADQSGPPAPPPNSPSYTQSQAAPIQRAAPAYAGPNYQGSGYQAPGYQVPGYPNQPRPQGPRRQREMTETRATLTVGQPLTTTHNTAAAHPAPGIFLRAGRDTTVEAVSLDAKQTELRVEHGIVNVSVHHPADNALILVDLPGGQFDLIKDGFYTFNATTNTGRVLVGEADAFSGSNSNGKPLKVKEDHAVVFSTSRLQSVEFGPQQARVDVLPGSFRPEPEMGFAGPGYGLGYGAGFYGEPYGYGYPYYAYGYPYGFYGGYPFGLGLGFGYGFYGGYGFGGGYGGFRGRR